MKRIFAITIGIGILATAGAAGTASQLDTDASVVEATARTTSQLSAAEVKALQEKFRYYPASNYSSLRSPI